LPVDEALGVREWASEHAEKSADDRADDRRGEDG
jgi:hypothetical protein